MVHDIISSLSIVYTTVNCKGMLYWRDSQRAFSNKNMQLKCASYLFFFLHTSNRLAIGKCYVVEHKLLVNEDILKACQGFNFKLSCQWKAINDV